MTDAEERMVSIEWGESGKTKRARKVYEYLGDK